MIVIDNAAAAHDYAFKFQLLMEVDSLVGKNLIPMKLVMMKLLS